MGACILIGIDAIVFDDRCKDFFKECRLVKRARIDKSNAIGEKYGVVLVFMGMEILSVKRRGC